MKTSKKKTHTNSMKGLQTMMMKPSDIQARIVKWMDVIGK
jgi:hypothetical protein